MLNTLASNDKEGHHHCVHLREWFDYRGHICMVFEKLGLSLYDFLRKNSYRPFHVDLVSAAHPPQALFTDTCKAKSPGALLKLLPAMPRYLTLPQSYPDCSFQKFT